MRFIGLFDIHVGYRLFFSRSSGSHYRCPTHDRRAIETVLTFAEDFRPDCVILGGDQLSMNEVSPHEPRSARTVAGMRLIESYKELDRLVLTPVERLSPRIKIWIDGNHEAWLEQVLNREPGLDGMVSPVEYLKLRERGWTVAGHTDVVTIGPHFAVAHGSVIRANKYPASKYSEVYRRNLRIGHYHRFEAFSDISPLDQRRYHTTVIVPSLCARKQGYTNGVPSNTVQGFLVGEMDDSGIFNDFVIILNNHHVIYNGVVYGPGTRRRVNGTGIPKVKILEDRTYGKVSL